MTHNIETASTAAQEFCDEGLAALAEAKEHRAAAAKDLQAAEYQRGQIEHTRREMQSLSAGIARREAEVARRERDQEAIIAAEANAIALRDEAKSLMAEFSSDRLAAFRALESIDARDREAAEAREAAKAARGKAEAA
jgi:hypothetical protein